MNGSELELDLVGFVFETNSGRPAGVAPEGVAPAPLTPLVAGLVVLTPPTAPVGGLLAGGLPVAVPAVVGEHLGGAVLPFVHGGGVHGDVLVLVHGGGVHGDVLVLVHGGGVHGDVLVLVHGGGVLFGQPV